MGEKELIKYKKRIEDFLKAEIDVLEYLKIKAIIAENKIDEGTKQLPYMIAVTMLSVGIIIKGGNNIWWVDFLFAILSIFFIIKVSNHITKMFNFHARAKTQVEIIKYCIEVKKQNKESVVLKYLNNDSDF
ncbi:hypothetical protein QFZ28_004379 [Neobacillus niacini]|uniref:hypothetical protein n=1 Tax=Neobacillus niacini TaxID=86668 RepID=UPI002782C2B9|nr:hypothetical protein [Neobacillus niacini]MDQ1003979.1 hypothetical protein [Neobacillus niacini]